MKQLEQLGTTLTKIADHIATFNLLTHKLTPQQYSIAFQIDSDKKEAENLFQQVDQIQERAQELEQRLLNRNFQLSLQETQQPKRHRIDSETGSQNDIYISQRESRQHQMFDICKNTCRSNSQEKCQKPPKLLNDEGEDRFEVSWSNSYGSSREPYIDKFTPNLNLINVEYEGADTMQFIRRKGQNTQKVDYDSDNTTHLNQHTEKYVQIVCSDVLSSQLTKGKQQKQSLKVKAPKISRKVITKCPHTTAQFYAKGMCEKCYHAIGRDKLATECIHTTRVSYVKGICKCCYLKQYHMRKKQLV